MNSVLLANADCVRASLDSPSLRDDPTVTMHLSSRPKSLESVCAIERLAASVIELTGARKAPTPVYLSAIGTIIADLIKAASYTPPRPCYRPLAAASFVGSGIGHGPFTRALKDLERNKFVSVKKGQAAWRDRPGTTTRIYVTPKLTDYLALRTITVANRYRHFSYAAAAEDILPIQLRARSVRDRAWVQRGRRMAVDWQHPSVIEYAAEVRNLNKYLAKQTIIGPEDAGLEDIALYRCFNNGDDPKHGYRQGGRTYAAFQTLRRKERGTIRINGEETVEIDISACFLTIAHYLLGWEFPNKPDLYHGPNLPRDIIKAWVNMTISYGAYHKRWPKKVLEKLAEKGWTDVSKRFPIKMVRESICLNMPIIPAWCESQFGWSELHYIESQIMMAAMTRLAFEFDVPSLPVHDALRASKRHGELVSKAVSDAFRTYTGITPRIG